MSVRRVETGNRNKRIVSDRCAASGLGDIHGKLVELIPIQRRNETESRHTVELLLKRAIKV
jgi:hypothetical protein